LYFQLQFNKNWIVIQTVKYLSEQIKIMESKIANLLGPIFAVNHHIGLTIGIIKDDRQVFFNHGCLNKTGCQPINQNTLFDIASITKVFTGLLLTDMVQSGLVKFEDKIGETIPELNSFALDISLLELVTHTSGLPRLPSNLTKYISKYPDNPYAFYTEEDLLTYFSQYRSNPNRAFNYSNLGLGLLGYILAKKLGISYEEAIVSRICDRLNLSDTRILLSPDRLNRLATPHTAKGKPTLNWDLPTLAGAGALRSTTTDLLNFVAANLAPESNSLSTVLSTSHIFRADIPAQRLNLGQAFLKTLARQDRDRNYPFGIATAWMISKLNRSQSSIYWHNGMTGGYQSFVGFVKENHTGVVVLSNQVFDYKVFISPSNSVTNIGFRILENLDNSTNFI
jgi:serine-type D-Ala-D-Ala carboxypeptidase/endopeptidase